MDPTDRHTADLYLKANPQSRSRIRLVNHFNTTGPGSIAALEQQGLWFFITTQASSHAVPSPGQFATGDALAIARALVRFPRPRVLVLCDTGNRASTEPALPRVLLSKPEHTTSFGPVLFDADGDVRVRFPAFAAAADHALGPPAR